MDALRLNIDRTKRRNVSYIHTIKGLYPELCKEGTTIAFVDYARKLSMSRRIFIKFTKNDPSEPFKMLKYEPISREYYVGLWLNDSFQICETTEGIGIEWYDSTIEMLI